MSFFPFFLSRSIRQSLQKMTEVAKRIAQGDFSQRLHGFGQDDLGELAHSINAMAANLERQFTDLQKEKSQLMTILEGMVEGVLVTNQKGRVILMNTALQEMLHLEGPSLGKTILECLRNADLHESVEIALGEGKMMEKEISLLMGLEEKYFVIHTAPLGTGTERVGSVSVFYDVTSIRTLENVRREFVANVSHELKTPLTNILGYAETLRGGALEDPSTAGRFLEKIEANAVQLRNLVEDILKLSEIESGRMEMHPATIMLKEVIEETRTLFEDKMASKQIIFETAVLEDLEIFADPSTLQQILGNLVENAVRYTPTGGRVLIQATRERGLCRVTVSDTGIGIHEGDIPRIFERFYRVDKARSRDAGGTGLGLSIVKHLVQAGGGEIEVKSVVGKGSLFSFTVPTKAG